MVRKSDRRHFAAYTIVVLLAATLLSACATKPFEQYLSEDNFNAFVPPRSQDGVGTIVAFDSRGQESIVAAASSCFAPGSIAPLQQAVVIQQRQFDLTSNDHAGLALPAAAGRKVDFDAGYTGTGVSKIKYQLIEPYTVRITQLEAQEHVKRLPATSPCRRVLTTPGNLVIHTVLGAKGVEYSFYDKNDVKLTLTATILQQLKLDPSFSRGVEGTTSLSLKDSPILVGYRAWEVQVFQGDRETAIALVPLQSKEVEALRAQKRR